MKVKEGQAFVPKAAWPDYEPPKGAKGWLGTVTAVRKDRVQLEFDDGSEYWFDLPMVAKWNPGVSIVTAARSGKPSAKKNTNAAAEKEESKPPAKRGRKPAAADPAAAEPSNGKRKARDDTPEPEPAPKSAKKDKEAASPLKAKLEKEKERKQAEKAEKQAEKERKALIKDIKAALPEASIEALEAVFAALHE